VRLTLIGQILGIAYGVYAYALFLGCLGVHLLLLLIYGWRMRRWMPARFERVMEVAYGLFNPLVYLLVFQPGIFRKETPAWLPPLGWSLLAAYWGYRLLGSVIESPTFHRHFAPRILTACVVLTCCVGIRDWWATFEASSGNRSLERSVFFALLESPLYFFPAAIALSQLVLIRRSPFQWEEMFFLESRQARAYLASGLVIGLASTAFAVIPRGERLRQGYVISYKDEIQRASTQYGVDPRLLASLIAVTQREHTTPFRGAVEDVVAGIWAADSTSHMLLSEVIDPSLGVTQIKPVTVLTALGLKRCSLCRAQGYWSRSCGGTEESIWRGKGGEPLDRCWWQLSKEYREVRLSDEEAGRFSHPALSRVANPVGSDVPTKNEVVEALADPTKNIEIAAFLIALYAAQWREANSDWSIDRRPEILATLFQIGFQRSIPKPDPKANDFGAMVADEMRADWILANF
jgi:hypothetical protein